MCATQTLKYGDIPCSAPRNITSVEIVLFDGFSLPAIVPVIEIFQRANEVTQPPRYEVLLVSSSGGTIASSSAVHVHTYEIGFDCVFHSSLLFIAGGEGAQRAARDERLMRWLRLREETSVIVCSISQGMLVLEAAGLSGRRLLPPGDASEHALCASRGSVVQTVYDVLKQDLGVDTATRLTRGFMSAPEGMKETISARMTSLPRVSEKIMASVEWIDANVDRPISIELAADVAAMSVRNFLRRFKAEVGMAPSEYLQHARLKLSCRMLRESQLPVDKIARRCGLGSGSQLAKLFKKHLSTTPTDYRSNNSETPKASMALSDREAGCLELYSAK